MNSPIDPIRSYADKYFSKTYLDKTIPNSELYKSFFTLDNFQNLIRQIETLYKLTLTETSYKHDILDTMFVCFEYHPPTLELLNNLVLIELRPKFINLGMDQNRYTENIYDNANTAFLTFFENPMLVTPRRESLSFADALFGPSNKRIDYFKNLPK